MDSFPASTLHIVPGSWAFIDFRQRNKHSSILEWILRTLTRQVRSLTALFFHPASQLFSPRSFLSMTYFPISFIFCSFQRVSCAEISLSYFTCDLQSPEADFEPRSNPCLLFWRPCIENRFPCKWVSTSCFCETWGRMLLNCCSVCSLSLARSLAVCDRSLPSLWLWNVLMMGIHSF